MDLKQTRRRGEELESAILDAAWQQLAEAGYSNFTFEAIAARADTSRTVLYRRWTDREELMKAAVRHAGEKTPVEVPDTGNLRDDVVTLLRRASEARASMAASLSVQLSEYFRESGTSFADLRQLVIHRARGIDAILDRAHQRGEVDRSKISSRVVELPLALTRHELLMTLAPVPDTVIDEIVDEVWLPLLRANGAYFG